MIPHIKMLHRRHRVGHQCQKSRLGVIWICRSNDQVLLCGPGHLPATKSCRDCQRGTGLQEFTTRTKTPRAHEATSNESTKSALDFRPQIARAIQDDLPNERGSIVRSHTGKFATWLAGL